MPLSHESGHDAVDDKEPVHTHSNKESDSRIVHFADHEARTNSPLYNHTHKRLCLDLDMPCWCCGVRNSDKQKNPNESHHFFGEWSMQGAYDWELFGLYATKGATIKRWNDALQREVSFVSPGLYNPQTGVEIGPLFNWALVKQDPTTFVDSEHNMVILCKDCHTSFEGIHHVPFPEWLAQMFAIKGYRVIEQAPARGV
jgi:hypothetical protein